MSADGMAALTEALLGGPVRAEAGSGIEDLCKASARKAVAEVLDVIFHGAHDDRLGIITLRYTEFSELLLRDIVRKAIDGCCE